MKRSLTFNLVLGWCGIYSLMLLGSVAIAQQQGAALRVIGALSPAIILPPIVLPSSLCPRRLCGGREQFDQLPIADGQYQRVNKQGMRINVPQSPPSIT